MAASPHLADRLIRELIASRRPATRDEIARIVERMATAPFNPAAVRVPSRERGAAYLGQTLGPREPSLIYHLVKRVAIEEQWARGTTGEQYLRDLRRAVQHPASRLGAFAARTESIVAAVMATEQVVPARRQGPQRLPHLLVVYSADQGIIRTGYQFSEIGQVDFPVEVRWLR